MHLAGRVLQGDPNQSILMKSIVNIPWKDDAAEAEAPILWPPDVKELTHWKET